MKAQLTHREQEILGLIIQEYTTAEIAHILNISTETIKTHRHHMMFKLKARNVAGLVRRAFEYEIVDPLLLV